MPIISNTKSIAAIPILMSHFFCFFVILSALSKQRQVSPPPSSLYRRIRQSGSTFLHTFTTSSMIASKRSSGATTYIF